MGVDRMGHRLGGHAMMDLRPKKPYRIWGDQIVLFLDT